MRVALGLGVVLLLACGDVGPTGPPDLKLAVDVCDRCRMIISEPRYATVGRSHEGEVRFDDLGCAEAYFASLGHEQVSWRVWVHDFAVGGWVSTEDAWIVEDRRVTTPMGYGLLAFADKGLAQAHGAEVGASPPRRFGEGSVNRGHPDANVEGAAGLGIGTGQKGVDVELADPWVTADELGQPEQDLDQQIEVDGLVATHPLE